MAEIGKVDMVGVQVGVRFRLATRVELAQCVGAVRLAMDLHTGPLPNDQEIADALIAAMDGMGLEYTPEKVRKNVDAPPPLKFNKG